jgi:polar amino acid transport system substrate-binding protein
MQDTAAQNRRRPLPALVLACASIALGAWLPTAAAGALDRAKASGKLTLGYATDAAPYASADASGNPSGFGIALCTKIGDAVKSELKMPALTVSFVPLQRDEAVAAVGQGKVDLLCGVVPTLERRAVADFSIPIILGGTGVAVRKDAPVRVMQALAGNEPKEKANWRGSTDQAPQRGVIAVIGNTVLEKGLADRLKERRINVSIVTVKDAAAGLQLLSEGNADAFFADRALLLEAVGRSKAAADVRVLDRLYRRDLAALGLQRGDEDFRLLVDKTLSHLFRTKEIHTIYSSYFGAPTLQQQDFYQLVAIPD